MPLFNKKQIFLSFNLIEWALVRNTNGSMVPNHIEIILCVLSVKDPDAGNNHQC